MTLTKILLAIGLFAGVVALVAGQSNGAVYGNGTIVTKDHAVKMFTSLTVETVAQVDVELQTMPYVTIVADENLLQYLKVEANGNQLRISPTTWIEPSRKIRIKVGTAFLKYLEPHGYGEYIVQKINTTPFEVNNTVSSVYLYGETDDLILTTGKGKIDASEVKAQNVIVKIEGRAKVTVDPQQSLQAEINGRGKVIYLNEPELVSKTIEGDGQVVKKGEIPVKAPPTPVEFIKCKIINNRISFTSVLIEGPEERQFSYGSDFGPFEAKNKNLPAGTRIYKVGADGKKKELLQISSWDKGRQLKLF
ncbi:MAG: DUF2807 domain-containing protein [Saprospiraceae bacterium]|nr:DUF2807 domain-containing protein [Saprospiraceae bacterium]